MSLRDLAALVWADEVLAATLAAADEPDRFVALALQTAEACEIRLDADVLRRSLGPDPLGMIRWQPPHLQGAAWPPLHWLPVQVLAIGGQHFVDWAYFGPGPLSEPFFEDSVWRALRRPFGRLFRYRMTLRDFLDRADAAQSLPPSGFIFHMSRCGSTLAAQMLAALPHSLVVSEATPIDAVVQASRLGYALSDNEYEQLLVAMVSAYGRRRGGNERHYVVKLDSWHTLALPLFKRAFPSLPWVFLYRDPVEVLVSQMRQPGTQMVAELMPPGLYGMNGIDGMSQAEYCTRVLERICRAVIENPSFDRGLLLNYCELPDAIATKLLPHFGITGDENGHEAMRLAATRDAKAPAFAFTGDAEAKQREASDVLRALANRHLGAIYRDLEASRTRSNSSKNL